MTFAVGMIAAAIAAAGFGSNFVPVKQYDMGDGMLFQLVMALGIWLVGLIYGTIDSFQTENTIFFHPFALLGGVIWALGNVCTVAIIKTIGMALGLAIWASTSILVGWFTGKFGLLGTPKDNSVKTVWLNYLGVVIILLSLIAFFQVSPSDQKENESEEALSSSDDVEDRLHQHNENIVSHEHGHLHLPHDHHSHVPRTEARIFNPTWEHMESPAVVEKRFKFVNQTSDLLARRELELEIENVKSWIDNLDKKHQAMLGLGLAMFAGVCYGLVFCPIQYLIETHKHDRELYPQTLEKYAFAHFSGILMTSLIIFIIYAIYMRNEPQTSHETLLPSLVCGAFWGIAQIAFFITQDKHNLGTDVSFPIVCCAPQIVASLWGVFVFKEVTGGASLCKLALAISIGVTGITCIALSK